MKALFAAQNKKLATICFTGANGAAMAKICDAALKVPSKTTARIQEMHITLGQMLCGALEKKLGLV
jgi:D-sedoheptulose 7-phosphate isomerase